MRESLAAFSDPNLTHELALEFDLQFHASVAAADHNTSFGSSLDRVDLGSWEISGDEVADRDHLVFVAVAPGSAFRGLDEGVRSFEEPVADPVYLP